MLLWALLAWEGRVSVLGVGWKAKLGGYLKPSETCDVIRLDCSDS